MWLSDMKHKSRARLSFLGANPPRMVAAERHTSNIAFMILFLGAISFLAQPVGYRPAGVPIALTLVTLFNVTWLIRDFRAKSSEFLLLAFFPIFLIVTDLMIGFDTRGMILALLLVFTYIGANLLLSDTQMTLLWSALAWVTFLLAVLGFYRYLSGYDAPYSENDGGIASLDRSYFYLGIAYLPSTRNSDAFYFVVGFLAALHLALRPGTMSLLYVGMVLFQSLTIALTLSRGAYVAALVTAILLLKRQQRLKAIIVATGTTMIGLVVLFSSSVTGIDTIWFLYSLIENAVISLFDPSNANKNVSGYYTYSNDVRLSLYLESFQSFLSFPFGQGIDNIHFGTPGNYTIRLHSENLYLDFLIIFGVFSVVLFAYVWRIFIRAIRLRKVSENARMGAAVLSACGLFAVFNSPVNLVIFWYVLVLGLAEIKRSVLLAREEKNDAASNK